MKPQDELIQLYLRDKYVDRHLSWMMFAAIAITFIAACITFMTDGDASPEPCWYGQARNVVIDGKVYLEYVCISSDGHDQ
jgi:hypothetical protein